jgi:hypothetical protein
MTQLVQANRSVDKITHAIVSHPLRQASGGALPFKKWAELNGINVVDKDTRKAQLKIYNDAKIEFYQLNRKVLSMAASDPCFNITKFRITDNDGFDASGRIPTKAQAKASKSSELARVMDENARLQRELDDLRKLVVPAPAA